MSAIPASSQYAIVLHDVERQYAQLWEKRILTPSDIAKAEKLMQRIKFLRLLVGAKNAR